MTTKTQHVAITQQPKKMASLPFMRFVYSVSLPAQESGYIQIIHIFS